MNKPVRHVIEQSLTESVSVIDFLQNRSGLSKRKLKDAMLRGAVWLRKGKGKLLRIRKATAKASAGDFIALYYDEQILGFEPTAPECLWSNTDYGVWYKPAGVLAQGSEYGDHASLPRIVQLADPLRKEVHVVHRLDREAYGLMLLARTSTAARRLSQMFQRQQIYKEYRIKVRGEAPSSGVIENKLDSKPAYTEYERLDYDESSNTSYVKVVIKTGRTHQIRRHFAGIGFPVIGDPRYGRDNQSDHGLALCAKRLEFDCPFSQEHRVFDLDGLKGPND